MIFKNEMKRREYITSTALAVGLSGCLGGSESKAGASNTAEEWWTAFYNSEPDKMQELTHSEFKHNGFEDTQLLGHLRRGEMWTVQQDVWTNNQTESESFEGVEAEVINNDWTIENTEGANERTTRDLTAEYGQVIANSRSALVEIELSYVEPIIVDEGRENPVTINDVLVQENDEWVTLGPSDLSLI